MTGGIISSIEPGSIAEELGWEVGDEIVSINGNMLRDVIDYRFHSSEEYIKVLLRRGEETAFFEIEKDYGMPLGVSFDEALFDGVRTCGANCIFCFVEQLPKGLRKSLYLKDDDYRLSFLHGNYVTLANAAGDDIERIVTQRLSPLYISVHTTDSSLREKMLGRDAPSILDQIDRLTDGRITLHTQIVLCRGINDGEYLDQSISDLAARYPTVASIAIVPVGLTAHRRNATPIGAIDVQYSGLILDKVKQWQRQFKKDKGTRLVWAADEFYLNAGVAVPLRDAYEGFPQLENGVGLVRKFKDSSYRAKRNMPSISKPLKVSLITGKLAEPLLKQWAESIRSEMLDISVFPIENKLFGSSVTVTGLMAGNDVIAQLEGVDIGDVLFVPSVALRDDTFLDDVTIEDVQKALKCKIVVVEPTPNDLVRALKLLS